MLKEDGLLEYLTRESVTRKSVVRDVVNELKENEFYQIEVDTYMFNTDIWENKEETFDGVIYKLDSWIKPLEDFYKEKGVKVLYDKVKINTGKKFNIGFKVDEDTDVGLAIKEERDKYVKRELENYLDILKVRVKEMTSPEMVEYIEGYVGASYDGYSVQLVRVIPKRILLGVEKEVKELVKFWEREGLDMEYFFKREKGSKYYDLVVEIKEK